MNPNSDGSVTVHFYAGDERRATNVYGEASLLYSVVDHFHGGGAHFTLGTFIDSDIEGTFTEGTVGGISDFHKGSAVPAKDG